MYDAGEPKNDLKKKKNNNKIRKGFLSSTALAVLEKSKNYNSNLHIPLQRFLGSAATYAFLQGVKYEKHKCC